MSQFIDMRLEPGLWLPGEWSLRWAVLIAALAVWFAIRPPRQAAVRLAAFQFVLVAGLLLPLIPHWWGRALLPAPRMTTADETATGPSIAEVPEPVLPRPTAKRTKAIAISPSQPIVGADANHADVSAMDLSPSAPLRAAEPLGARGLALLIVASLWSCGMCVQLIRLFAATLWLSHLRRSALTPQARSQDLFDRCRQEIGLRRAIRLGTHSALTAPIFVGGRRCMVLVPSDWEQLPIDAQRAVLWHELAHVARRDDWAKLTEEILRAAFFFHPLVHWLLNRIDGYREQVCDAAAIRRGVTGRLLAQVLVDFGRRNLLTEHLDPVTRPALQFFRRRTVKNRIRELLGEDTLARWSAPIMRRQLAGLATIVIGVAIALGSVGTYPASTAVAQATIEANSPSPAAATPSTPPEKTAVLPKGSDTAKTLERILTNWKARKERTRSLYFAWDSRLFVGQAAVDRRKGKTPKGQDIHSGHVNYWAEGPDRSRIDIVAIDSRKPTHNRFTANTRSMKNGMTECLVEEPGQGAGPPIAMLTQGRQRRLTTLATYWELNGLTLAFHPLDFLSLNPPSRKFRVVSENALINGRRCVEIQNSNQKGNNFENWWVDPARDDVVVAYEFWVPPLQSREPASAVSIEHRHDQTHGWVPARWTYDYGGCLVESTVSKFAINERLPEDTFSLDVAPGTLVFDMRTAEQYRAATNGGKSDVVQFDSPLSLFTQRVLEAKSDVSIEPQSLKDALEFVATRYGIPIVLYEKDFKEAVISTAVQVHEKRSGMRVVDLLKILFDQCPKPIGFRIEDEVLKVSPKFTEQGALRVRPAPSLPEPASSRARQLQEPARKIQLALEMPVDFSIEPQSLKDALEFIAARYQIRIESDPLMDSLIEVRGACPGVKLRSLLSILLEQCPGQLAFKIDRDVLKIYPEAKP
ncbi:MAG TPA: M56 family metallopeptidase [Planctomycetaceae bacterium]|nr:M56 family metallopeptidase [Planctomycetaceae bacterium]